MDLPLLQTFPLQHHPPGYDVHVALFTDVSNASFLHEQLLAGNSDFEYAFIDASIIAEAFRRFGIAPATPTSAGTTSLLAVKVSTPDHPVTAEATSRHLRTSVQGTSAEFTDTILSSLADLQKVRKYYKLNSSSSGPKSIGDSGAPRKKVTSSSNSLEAGIPSAGSAANGHADGFRGGVAQSRELEVQILGVMALRGMS